MPWSNHNLNQFFFSSGIRAISNLECCQLLIIIRISPLDERINIFTSLVTADARSSVELSYNLTLWLIYTTYNCPTSSHIKHWHKLIISNLYLFIHTCMHNADKSASCDSESKINQQVHFAIFLFWADVIDGLTADLISSWMIKPHNLWWEPGRSSIWTQLDFKGYSLS